MENLHSMEFEKYKKYLISTWLPEYEAEHTERDLMVEGWNMLLDEVFSPLIAKELGMRYLGNRIWADDYCNHRRRVLSLFQQTDLGGSFKWGWNYDFIPKMSAKKAVYVRTDKSIFTHFFENIWENHNKIVEGKCQKADMTFNRCYIDSADFENSMRQRVKAYEAAFYYTLPLIRLYVAYTGLIKRETSKALHAVINFVVVFVLSASFIAYAPDYIKKINEFSSDISTASLDLGTKIMLPNSDSEGKDSVDLIRDSLFSIQVEQPWLLLQFGNSNAEEIGTDRVEALVSASPEDEDGKTREEVVKTEIEDNDNNNLTIPQVVNRLGMVFFLLFFNLGITIFVFLLTGMMLFSQILFIIFAMFLPISFLLSMIPSYESMAKQAIVRVFNTIMTRAGITLIVTVAFSISSMFYNISTDYPFFMVAFLQIVCFAGIYMKLGDLMSMFSLNANDSQSMGRRIFRRPYLYLAHRARRMERRLAGAVTAGGVAGAVAGSSVAGKRAERKNTASKENRGNTTSSMGQRAGSKVGAVLDTKNKVKDKANAVKENIKDMPTQTAYAVYSAKEKAKSSVSDFKRGMVQEQQSRQSGRMEKREQHRQNIADKRMELQKAQEARQAQRKADGSATTGATRPHERPATASTIPKPSVEKTQEVKRPATATTSKASEPVKTNVIKERPLSSGASDRKATQSAQPVHRQNVEKVVSQETRQNDTKDRRTKVQQTQSVQKNQQTIEKTRNLVTKKGQKKK